MHYQAEPFSLGKFLIYPFHQTKNLNLQLVDRKEIFNPAPVNYLRDENSIKNDIEFCCGSAVPTKVIIWKDEKDLEGCRLITK